MTIYYPDISSHQSGISLAGALAVCCKVTEGTGYTNPDYAPAKQRAKAAGAFFFAYHFLYAGNAAAQARYCFGVVGKTPLMVDAEANTSGNPKVADVTEFADEYRKLGGTVHLVYLPRWYWGNLGSPSLTPLTSRDLALVSSDYTGYSDASGGAGWQAYGGATPAIWQYTDALTFHGQAVDFNAFQGTHAGDQSAAAVADTLDQLKALVRTGAMPTPTPSPTTVYRHVIPAAYNRTIDHLAQSRNTAVAHLQALTLANANAEHRRIFNDYMSLRAALAAANAPSPDLPEGLVYYTSKP